MKCGVFNTTREETARACSEKHRIHNGREKHSYLAEFKTMLVCFFDHKGIVNYELIAQGQ
jgi:hypothetical protein